MRIICPNCGAQYAVPDAVIPETGRDVQCSNCGETWFQPHPDHPPAQEGAPAPQDEPRPPDEQDEEELPDWEESPEEAAEQPAPGGVPKEEPTPTRRHELDPEVARLLREEAEREARARAAEAAAGLETQPDLGLSPAEPASDGPANQGPRRTGHVRDREDAVSASAIARTLRPASRRNLLPDIEETASAITADATASSQETATGDDSGAIGPAPASGGFRRGFRLAVALAVVATLVYLFAPRLGEAVPSAAPALDAYVEWVNMARLVVNERVSDLLAQLRDITGS